MTPSLKFKNISGKKQRASIILTLSIFILAIIIFSICAIDAGYVVTSRYKTQKITETFALYAVSKLNSLPESERSESSIKDMKEHFEKLYSENKISGYWSFKITDIEIKDKNTHPKVKVSTETIVPPLFLRYARIGAIKIRQTAYASSTEESMIYDSSLSRRNYFTMKANKLFTDKAGADLKVQYDGGYFAFAGLVNSEGKIQWVEIGSLASGSKTEFTLTDKVTNEKFRAYCIENTNTFDLDSDPEKTIGLVKYLRIYKMDCSTEEIPAPTTEEAGGEGTEGTGEGEVSPPDTEGGEAEGGDEGGETTPPEGETTPDDTATPPDDTTSPDESETGAKSGEEAESTGEEEIIDDSPTGTPPVVTILNSVKLIKKSKF